MSENFERSNIVDSSLSRDFTNEDVLTAALESGDPQELTAIAEALTLPAERVELMSHYAILRRQMHDQMLDELQQRRQTNSVPTAEELQMGAYIEQIEPHVRGTVLNLRRKGYSTYISGFSRDDQVIGFENDELDPENFPDDVRDTLYRLGVEIFISPRSIKLHIPTKLNADELRSVWEHVEQALPDRGAPAEPTRLRAAELFREKYSKQSF